MMMELVNDYHGVMEGQQQEEKELLDHTKSINTDVMAGLRVVLLLIIISEPVELEAGPYTPSWYVSKSFKRSWFPHGHHCSWSECFERLIYQTYP